MVHMTDGERQAAAAALRVLVMPTDEGFFAQGLEIDYVATGRTEEEVREHFAKGFIETVHSYMRRKRDLAALFSKSTTPREYWALYYASAKQHTFKCAVRCDVAQYVPENSPVPSEIYFCKATERTPAVA
jgi:hypothetical protein